MTKTDIEIIEDRLNNNYKNYIEQFHRTFKTHLDTKMDVSEVMRRFK